MTEKSNNTWSPSRTYDFTLKIGKIDLSKDLMKLSILTSIDNPYQTFILELYTDVVDMIIEKLYGQTPLKLTSKLYGTSPATPLEQLEFNLMYLSNDMPVRVSIPVGGRKTGKERNKVVITCVARDSYTTMNTLVNSVYQGQNMSSILNSIVSEAGGTIKLDSQGINGTKFDQVLIPSSTLYNNLIYLNRTFGIYNGTASMTCSYDNKVYIKNLTSKIKNSSGFILYQLPLDQDNTKIIKSCNDGKRFYTRQPLQTKYTGNSAFAYIGPTMKHVVKPKDRLYHTFNINLEDLAKSYGIISKGNKLYYDSRAMPSSKRISVHKDHTGYELTETFINAKYSKRISAISETGVHIEQSMKILKLMNVGEAVKINTGMDVTRDYSGLYILRSSYINFSRVKDWESSADVLLIRTNRSLT